MIILTLLNFIFIAALAFDSLLPFYILSILYNKIS
jgi:hypothetical protein